MMLARNKVEKHIRAILQHYNGTRKVKGELIEQFKKRGFLAGEINSIFSGTNPVEQLTDEMLGLFVWELYNGSIDKGYKHNINPEKVLSNVEIEKIKMLKVDRKEKSMYPLTIVNVNEDMTQDYSTVFTNEMIVKLFDNRVFKYNYETQRPLISKFYGDQEVKEIYLNKKNREEMVRNILEGNQIPDEITLNLLETGDEKFNYNIGNRDLTILSGYLDVIDGWHRIMATRDAYHKDPSVPFSLKVRIVHWDIDKAKAFIRQKSMGTPLSILAKKSYDVYNQINQVIDKLNTNSKSNLRGMIGTTSKSLIKHELFFDTCNVLFKVEDNSDIVTLSNHLKGFFNAISDNNPDLLKHSQDDIMWVTYLIVAAKHLGNELDEATNEAENLNFDEIKQVPFKKANKIAIKKIEEIISRGVNVNV
jgi:hypothetical protein